MSDRRAAAVLAAGTELTEGIIQDTHARFLASELTAMGFRVVRCLQVPDDARLFETELGRAVEDAALVVITGGLGPTSDDLTRETVAGAAAVPLEFHEEVWEALRERFKGRVLPEANRKQAMAPRGFPLIPNANGTAPGFYGEVAGALVVALPGPPSELRPMWSLSVRGLLGNRFGIAGADDILWATALMVPESSLEEALVASAREGITWGTRVDEDRIVFSLRGGSASGREEALSALAARLGEMRIRRGDRRPAEILTDALAAAGKRLVTAESCTGGLVGKWMTDLPGSSRVYWGGIVAYADESKGKLLGVDRGVLESAGAVSRETVQEMARGALESSDADLSIAVSGVAGPDGGTAEKPVGTVWVAAAARGGGMDARLLAFSGGRDAIRRRSAVASFLLAEAVLLGKEFLDTLAKW